MKAKELIKTLELYPEAVVCFEGLGNAYEIVGSNIVPMQMRERGKDGFTKITNYNILVLNTE